MTDPDDSLTRHMILHSSAAMYGGGADTTTSAMTTFFLQMILNPDIQARAAAEVDNVVEASRLPDASDKANLPYINALVRECMRILPVAPLGVPHRLNQEDRYDGFILPKDTIVYANIWSILHDERSYPEPEVFLPERHLNLNELPRDTARERDPFTYAFGYGRRRCPGQYLAEMTLFVAMAGVLSLFEIRPGKSDPRSVGSTTGAFTHPEQFDCELVLRSKERAALLG